MSDGWDSYTLWWMEWDEFVAWRNGYLTREELLERVDRRRNGREPVEPPRGSEQSDLRRWSD